MPFSSSKPAQNKRLQQRSALIFKGGIFLALAAVAVIGATQIKVIREFFSQASGTPANLEVDTQAVLGTMPRPWRHLAQGGEDHAWRMQPINTQVKALNPEYVRLDHIYDFYDIVGGTPGNLTFDFTKFDAILSDIKAAGAKPYIALSYMPPAIAEGDIVSKPKLWTDWQLVIQKTIEHVSGTLAVEDVYYEVWNEPDLFGGWKYGGSKNYLDLYTYAARGADKAAKTRGVRDFKFGGPAITALYKNWFNALAEHAIKNNLRYDFFSWHRYTTDLDQYPKDMAEVKTWIQAYPQLEPNLEFHITEWGHDSNNNAGYDTRFAAAHTVAGSITMLGVIDKAFVFEIQDGKDPNGQPNWGRWGMFTHADAGAKPKPRYQALRMLDRLSDQRLQLTGQGSWVKALAAKNVTTGNTEVVVANYDAKGAHGETVPITFSSIVPGNYVVKKEYLSGARNQEKIATTAAALKVIIPMTPNDVVWVELSSAP
jgi:xylan 1,4-beta-xylosidase